MNTIVHCDYKFPLNGGYVQQLEIRASVMSGISVNNRDIEMTILSSIRDHDCLITIEFIDREWSCRHYSNGIKLPRKYNKYVNELLRAHLERFPEITLDCRGVLND